MPVIDALIAELSVPAPPQGDARVRDACATLWRAAFDEEPPPVPSPRWKELGFQGSDPWTDLRGGGWASLDLLLRLMTQPRTRAEARGLALAAADDMPLGIACVNVLYMLRCHLRLFREPPTFCPCCGVRIRAGDGGSAGDRRRTLRAMRGFAALAADYEDALLEVLGQALALTSKLWSRRFVVAAAASPGALAAGAGPGARRRALGGAGDSAAGGRDAAAGAAHADGDARLLRFPEVLLDVRCRVVAALAEQPSSPRVLRRELGLDRVR